VIWFFSALWLAMLTFGLWVYRETPAAEKRYKLALCDSWRAGRWYFHADAHDDYVEAGR
jgi:hypothetical protein